MKSLFRATPCGDTIFCDDVRHEVTGKVTLVGVYGGYMFLMAPFPAKVKLAMRITYQEHKGESDDPLQLHVYLPDNKDGEPHFKTDVPLDFRKAVPFIIEGDDENTAEELDQVVSVVFHLEMNELNLPKPGRIRVRMVRGDTVVRLGSLTVSQLPTPSPSMGVIEASGTPAI
jgi:hypothetical protein